MGIPAPQVISDGGSLKAHNLARWTARIGLGERTVITKTLRRRVFALVGRITRSARRLTLHLPRRWPWIKRSPALKRPSERAASGTPSRRLLHNGVFTRGRALVLQRQLV